MIPPAALPHAFDNLDHLLRVEELYLLQRVAQKINAILDLEMLLDEVVGDVANTFGYTRLAVLLKDGNELEIAAGWSGELCLKGTRYKIGEQDGMSGHAAATGETVYSNDVQKIPFYIAGEQDTRSEIDIPLKIRGEMIGIFNIQHTEINGFTPERIRLLEALAGHVATAIGNARMFDRERREKERMARELDEARAIQFSLFPQASPRVEGFQIDGICLPCREVGGDWYDYIPLGDGRIAVVLADVSGKGMGAALLMASARSVIRLHALPNLSPGQVLTEVNRVLLSDFPSARFVTLIYAIVDQAAKTITFANAGHLYPLLLKESTNGGISNGEFLETKSGLPLGIMECDFAECAIEMPPGSHLFLYTDGITEAVNTAGDEYGAERLQKHVATQSISIASVLADVNKFTAGFPATDDMTVMTISSNPRPKG
jgi:sigma-B regulation protein RsbU (phosphoserine phosphatase)